MTTCPNLYLLSDLSSEHEMQLFNCLLRMLNGKPHGKFKCNLSKVKLRTDLFSNWSSDLVLFTYAYFCSPHHTSKLYLEPFPPAFFFLLFQIHWFSVGHCRTLLTGHTFFKSLLSTVHPEPADVHMFCKNILYAFTSLYKSKAWARLARPFMTGSSYASDCPLLSFSKLLNTSTGFCAYTQGFLSACSISILLLRLMNSFNYSLSLKLPPLWSHASMHAQLSIHSIP